jgi:hypothetical protein
LYLKDGAVKLLEGLHGVLWKDKGDERNRFALLGFRVDRHVDLRQWTWKEEE